MARPYSDDLRERVVSAVMAGESTRVVADRFGVAVSSVVKWSQRYRRTGSVAPGKMGGHRRRILEPHRDFIVDQIRQTPRLTLHRLRDLLDQFIFCRNRIAMPTKDVKLIYLFGIDRIHSFWWKHQLLPPKADPI